MNYALHNKELDGTLYTPDESVIFTKADSSLLTGGKPFFIPDGLAPVDYEAELVVRVSRMGKTIPKRFAHRYYDAVTVGIDFTARALQRRLRDGGMPWDLCKGFDGAAVVGAWVGMDEAGDFPSLEFRLDVNGRTVQRGRARDMVFGVDDLIAYASRFFTLKTGDLIFTGTPEGVGPVKENDHLTGWLGDRKVLEFNAR